MRKAAFGMMLALLVLSAPFFVFDAQQVNANGSIYIRADGSIEGTDKIVTLDNVTYTLVGNINNSIIVERDNIVVDGAGYTLQGTGSDAGIELPGSNNVTIKNVTITKFCYGIYFPIFDDGNYVRSSYCKIVENKITDNWYGIFLGDSDHNIILGNCIVANTYAAIRLGFSSNTNLIVANNITDNHIGISIAHGWSNRCHHNSFVNNTIQVEAEADYSSNVWDNDYPSGGNYWSDYNGTDFYSGPYQTESGSDGIGDTPVIINTRNSDRYPLMSPSVYKHTFVLTITTTLGGTTNPEPGIYVYDVITYVSVIAVPFADYMLDHWILDNGNEYGDSICPLLFILELTEALTHRMHLYQLLIMSHTH
jgi:parallel beta-helix repeat protein